ncbi:MAG: hypothetical protein EXR98_21190 [Gemmataceae bacterium]|nr:hypothetical protein [Gemmataceae bacterium]
MRYYHLGIVFAMSVAALAWQADADAGGTKSESKVKAKVETSKIDTKETQTVTITLDIVKGWHLYANPVNHEFLEGAETKVKITSKAKLKGVRVMYPAGKVHIDKKEKYDIYEGVVKIQAVVQRNNGDTNPLEIVIDVQACDSSVCLQPSKLKLMVP